MSAATAVATTAAEVTSSAAAEVTSSAASEVATSTTSEVAAATSAEAASAASTEALAACSASTSEVAALTCPGEAASAIAAEALTASEVAATLACAAEVTAGSAVACEVLSTSSTSTSEVPSAVTGEVLAPGSACTSEVATATCSEVLATATVDGGTPEAASTVAAEAGSGEGGPTGTAIESGIPAVVETTPEVVAKATVFAVVPEAATVPIAAIEASTEVAESIVDAAVESDRKSPIAGIPDVDAAAPAPITGRPEPTYIGRKDPSAVDPVVATIAPCPVAGRPDIAVTGAFRLLIVGDGRRSVACGDANSYLGLKVGHGDKRGSRDCGYCQEGANCAFNFHSLAVPAVLRSQIGWDCESGEERVQVGVVLGVIPLSVD